MVKRIAVKDLRAGSIDATPINIDDWREVFAGHDEESTFWEAQTCDTCGAVYVFQNGGGDEQHKDAAGYEDDFTSTCEGYLSLSEGPMMNYWYPVDLHWVNDNPEEAARRIVDLPLCVVQINGDYGLALTGGGMDFSWEICEAYTRLRLLPPVHFCDLPGMAGRGTSPLDRYLFGACRASIRVKQGWLKNTLRSLRNTENCSKRSDIRQKG